MQPIEDGSVYTSVIRQKDLILFRGKDSSGNRIAFKEAYRPTIFLSSQKHNTGHTDIHGKPVEPFNAGSMSETLEFVYSYSKTSGTFSIYGNTQFEYPFIADLFPAKKIQWKSDQLNVIFLDIETRCDNGFPNVEKADQQINAITLKVKGKKYVFGVGEFTIPECQCFKFDNEPEMLTAFLDTWKKLDPDIIVGWNIRFFDIPYLVNRIEVVLQASKKLSPWGIIKGEKVNYNGDDKDCYELLGIATLDYLELYKKFTFVTRESYKLDHIAEVELGEKKLDWGSKFETLQDFYTQDFQMFMEYNVKDVDLVERLDQKLHLIDMVLNIAYLAKINFEDVYSQIRTWDTIIYNHLREKNLVIPMKDMDKEHTGQYAGAFVKDPITGIHDWVVSYDLTSLYPMLIRFCNIGPDTIVENHEMPMELLKLRQSNPTVDNLLDLVSPNASFVSSLQKHNLSMSANLQFFRKEKQSFLSELVEEYFTARKNAKKKSIEYKKLSEDPSISKEQKKEYEKLVVEYDTLQLALKVNLNSLYGGIGAVWFRYYDPRQAEAITLTGQLAIRWIETSFNKYLNKSLGTKNYDYVIAVDTDSNYLRLGNLVQKLCPGETDKSKIVAKLDEFCKQVLDPFIKKKYDELGAFLNVYAQTMDMKREAIADRGIWVAKKRYALNVHNSEGVQYAEPKLKIQGIEVQRSSTPKICRDELKKAIKIILTSDETTLNYHVAEVEKKFQKATVEEIAFPRGVKGLVEYSDKDHIYAKGCPIHVRGALVFNDLLKRKKLTKKYNLIQEGDKIKFVYVKVPNNVGGNIIAFLNVLPKELECHKYIDYDLQFEKAFLDPLKGVLEAVGWSARKQETLESLFS